MENCIPKPKPICPLNVTESDFGITHDGRCVTKYTVKNKQGMALEVINYGATITGLKLPMKCGPHDVVLGFDDMKGYLSDKNAYFGASIGRVTNRTRPPKFKLKDECICLTVNQGKDIHLHGGCTGFSKVLWKADTSSGQLIMKYVSRDGEEGYPGNLELTATFQVTDENCIFIKYHATTDKLTLINITNHCYFNLAGHAAGAQAVMDHQLTIEADNYTVPCDNVPTGEIRAVERTAYDFREPTLIGDAMSKLKKEDGFDLNYCLRPPSTCLRLCAKACYEPKCVVMEVYSNAPGLQFYTGNNLKDVCGKECTVYNQYAGFCLELQGYPNAANIKNFPSITLAPGEEYNRDILLKFIFPGTGKPCADC